MTHLRQAMLDELHRRNYAASTITYYVKNVEQFARFFKRSPDRLNHTHLRTYQAYLLRDRKLFPMRAYMDPALRATGIGTSLVTHAVESSRSGGHTHMIVATAAADIDNLRFYQRLGFRLRAVDRDAFTAADGYPGSIEIDGIPLLDRVWLAQALPAGPTDRPADQV